MEPTKMQPSVPQMQPVLVATTPNSVNTSALRKVAHGILFVLMFACNIAFLGCVAAAQAKCKALENPWDTHNSASLGFDTVITHRTNKLNNQPSDSTDIMSVGEQCRYEYSFHWWIVFFQLFTLVMAIVVACSTTAKSRFTISVALWAAVVTALVMYLVSVYNGMLMAIKIAKQTESDSWKAKTLTNNQRSAQSSVIDDVNSLQSATLGAFISTIVLSMLDLVYLFVACDSILAPQVSLPQKAPPHMYMQQAPPHAFVYAVPAPATSHELPPTAAAPYMPQPTAMPLATLPTGAQPSYGAPTYGAPPSHMV